MKNHVTRTYNYVVMLFANLLLFSLLVGVYSTRIYASTKEALPNLDGFYYEIYENEVIIKGYDGSNETVAIPNTILGLPVTTIYYDVFSNNGEEMTHLIIPANVEVFLDDLYYCSNLQVIEVSSENSFFSSIEGVLYNKNITSLILYPQGKILDNYKIPEGVTTIEEIAFTSVGNLDSVEIPSTVSNIETGFNFSDIQAINVDIQNQNYSSIDGVLFSKDKTVLIRIPQGKLNNNTNYTIPDGVKTVLENALLWVLVNNLDIPASVEELEIEYRFYCNSFSVDVGNLYYSAVDGVLFDKGMETLICFPKASEKEEHINYKMSNNVLHIEKKAFDSSKLENIILSENLETIGEYAFMQTELLRITIPGSVKNISENAFWRCINLIAVILQDGVESISDRAFNECESLKWISVPESVKTMETNVFRACDFDLLTIYGTVDSMAKKYAELNEIPFQNGNISKVHIVSFEDVENGKVNRICTIDRTKITDIPSIETERFQGWYKDEELTQAWDFENDIVIDDMILYAKYKSESSLDYSISFGDGVAIENGVVLKGLPNGVSFDSNTITLTLNNASIPSIEFGNYGTVSKKLILNIVGNNYVTSFIDTTSFLGEVSINADELIVTGTGTLNMKRGILSKYFTMESGNLNITTENNYDGYSFYAISTPSYENDTNPPNYEFNGGSINIIDSGHPERYYSVGIDSQHGNISIKNTTIKISLKGKTCYGIASGFIYNSGEQYGGDLSIQNSTIDCNVSSGRNVYCYKLSIADNTQYYTGEKSLSKVTAKDTFDYNEDYNRFQCSTQLLRIEAGNGELINPLTFIHVNYVLNGGENSSENLDTYYNEEVVLKNPTKTGYTFLGWYTDNKFTSRITTIPKTVNMDYTLYAKWEKIKEDVTVNSITLNKNNIKLSKGKSTTLKATILPTNATDKKITWVSSNTKVATVSNGTIKAVNGGTTTITASAGGKVAKCTITVPYSIKYVLNGGKNNAKNPNEYINQKITLQNPTKKGYLFKGWYTNSKLTKKISSISKTAKKNYTIYAKWEKVKVNTSKITSLKNSTSKKAMIKFKKVNGASGYELYCSTNSKFKKANTTKVTTKKTSYTFSKLKKRKTYYIKVRAYKKDSANYKVYGKWSATKKITIKK